MRHESPAKSADLVTGVSATDTAFVFDAADLEGYSYVLEREVIYIPSAGTGSAPNVTYTGVVRGQLATDAVAHGAGARDDTALFLHDPPPLIIWRRAELRRVSVRGSYADEVVVARGVVNNATRPKRTRVQVSCDGYLAFLSQRKICTNLWRGYQSGGSVQFTDFFGAQNFEGRGETDSGRYTSAASFAVYSYGEKTAVIANASFGDSVSGSNRSLMQLNSGTRTLGGGPVFEIDPDITEIWECFSTHPEAPELNDNGVEPTQRRLATNIFDTIRQIITTTDAPPNTPGDNGDYDLGIAQLGCAVPEDAVDWDSWEDVRAFAGDSALQPQNFLGFDGQPLEAYPWIQNKLALYGAVLCEGADGRLRFARLRDSLVGGEVAISNGDFSPGPLEAINDEYRDFSAVISRLEIRNTFIPGSGARSEPFENSKQLRRYPYGSSLDRDLDGEGFDIQGDDLAKIYLDSLAMWHVARFARPIPYWSFPVRATETLLGVSTGDLITVTNKGLLGRKADEDGPGVTDAVCIVLERAHDIDSPTIDMAMWWVGAAYSKTGLIGPAATVASVSSNVITINANTFSATLLPGQTSDADGFKVGQVVRITTRDRVTLRGTATITALTSAKITLNSMPAGTVSGDLMQLADYGSQPSAEQAAWVFCDRDFQWVS